MGLDERAKRKPNPSYGEAHCHPVVLADGNPWLIARPSWQQAARFKDGRAVETVKWFGYSTASGIDDLVEALPHVDDPEVLVSVVATIAAELLSEVYTLTQAELDQLLAIRPSDPDPLRWVRAVADVVTFQESTIPGAELAEAVNGR